jgi:hypothetical protein
MAENKVVFALMVMTLSLLLYACNQSEGKPQNTEFRQVPEIVEIKPQKPVKVKLKRSVNGSYSWEVSGDDTDKVIQANAKLKEALESNNAEGH